MKTSLCTDRRVALYAGSFDPFTAGHEDIVRRALTLFDAVVVAVGRNVGKQPLLSVDERLAWIRAVFANEPRVTAVGYDGLTAPFARELGACCLLRGVRSAADYDREATAAVVNRRLAGLDTVLLPARPELAHVSSSLVRELLRFGADVEPLLPANHPHMDAFAPKTTTT